MKKRLLALVMAVMMAFTFVPAGDVFAANAVAASEKAAKSSTLKITSVKTTDPSADNYGLVFKWNKVDGVKYQYRYRTADSADFFKAKVTKKNSAKISFLSYENITFQVRTVKTTDGQKVYGKWATKKLKAERIDKMLCKQLNLKDGYVKNGLIYIGGLYASDKNHSDCDLEISLFAYLSQTNTTLYIISKGAKVVTYGYLENKPAKLSDGTEYTAITAPMTGKDGKDETYGYVFTEVENGTGYVITADGQKVVAKDMDVSYAWDIQAVAE